MTLRETIEPCPFCRSAPKVGYMGDEDGGYAYVECSKPDHFAGSHMETEAEAITAWNTRSLPEIEKITEALEKADGALRNHACHGGPSVPCIRTAQQCRQDCGREAGDALLTVDEALSLLKESDHVQ